MSGYNLKEKDMIILKLLVVANIIGVVGNVHFGNMGTASFCFCSMLVGLAMYIREDEK